MELTDLQKLESAPKLERISSELQNLFSLYHFWSHEVEIQNHFDQVGFAFTVPQHDDQEHRIKNFDNEDSIYLYHIMNNSFGFPTVSDNMFLGNSAGYILTSGSCIFEVTTRDYSKMDSTISKSSSFTSSAVHAISKKGLVEVYLKEFMEMLKGEINRLKRSNWLETVTEYVTYFENPFNFYFEQGRKQLDALIYRDKLIQEMWTIEEEINVLEGDGEYRFAEQDRIDRGIDFDEYYEFESAEVAQILNKLKELEEKLEGLENLSKNYEHLSPTAVFFLFIASLEGLLNLIFEIYMFKELREDDRVKASISRAQIDVKLRTIPVYCSCFKDRLISSDETFKKIHSIFNLRNDLIHANMTSAMTARRYEINSVFFYSFEDKKNKYGLPQTARSLTIENLQFVCETVEKMVEQIMASMKPRYKREFEQVLHQDGFYARLIDGEYVIDVNEK